MLQYIDRARVMASLLSNLIIKLLIIWLMEFLELDVKMNMIIKNVKCVELNTKITIAFLKTKTLNLI